MGVPEEQAELRDFGQTWEASQMRLSLIGFVVIVLAGLTPALAASQNATMRGHYHYATCSCHFGYGGGACVADVACASEGGRCSASCGPTSQPGQ